MNDHIHTRGTYVIAACLAMMAGHHVLAGVRANGVASVAAAPTSLFLFNEMLPVITSVPRLSSQVQHHAEQIATPAVHSPEHRPLGKAQSLLPARTVQDAETGLFERLGPRAAEILKVGSALAGVVGLIFLVRAVLRRSGLAMVGGAKPSGVLQVLARYPIGRGQSLVVLKLARRLILLHQSGTSMRTLSEISNPDEVAAVLQVMESGTGGNDALRFKNTLREFAAGYSGSPTTVNAHHRDLPPGEAEVVDLTRRNRGAGWRFWRSGGAGA